MRNLKRILTRDVTKKECPWLSRTFKQGEVVYHCIRYTYGCITESGEACTMSETGDYPFFELPSNSISEVQCQKTTTTN